MSSGETRLLEPAFACSIPGKTFLVGEYLAISGGLSVVIATRPCFEISISSCDGRTASSNFHSQSPAGRLLNKIENQGPIQIDFVDPYLGYGGFGASTAQFLAVGILGENLKAWNWGLQSRSRKDLQACLKAYQEMAWQGKGAKPSGADLVGQIHGQITAFQGSDFAINNFSWPFEDLGFSLFHTGHKLATHLHLAQWQARLPLSELQKLAEDAVLSLRKVDSEGLVQAVANYAAILDANGLLAQSSKNILQSAATEFSSEILAAKGCGAMGNDVLLFLHSKSFDIRRRLKVWGQTANLRFFADDSTLDLEGLSVRMKMDSIND